MNELIEAYEDWIKTQSFYVTLRFAYGDALFIRDEYVYRTLPMQMAWLAWQTKHDETGQVVKLFNTRIEEVIQLVEKRDANCRSS